MKGQGKRHGAGRGERKTGEPVMREGDCTLGGSWGPLPASQGAAVAKIGGFAPTSMPKAPSPTAPPVSYEAALEELEQLTGLIESGQLPLEQLLTGYQRGAELLRFCRDRLEAVENQIKVLDEGALKPWTQE